MKKVLAGCLVVVMLFALCACGISKEDVVGSWKGSWVYNGTAYTEVIIIDEDGTYISGTYKNGVQSDITGGKYEIEGSKLKLIDPNDSHKSTPYEYKGGSLYNGDTEFTRIDKD